MKKLQKILMLTVLVAMLIGIAAVAASAAVTTEPSRTLASFDGEQSVAGSGGTQRCTIASASKGGNKYYEIDFIDSGANANFGGGNQDFLGKGDYIIMEFDFMAEDWSTVKNILIGWNSRNSTGGALNDMHFTFSNEKGAPKITGNPLTGSIVLDPTPGVWHHFSMVVQIGGEHVNKNGKCLTAVRGQDAVEAYAYVDGQFFAQNLIGDGKEFWAVDTTYFQTLRLTASGGGQKLCFDNVRVVQYESNRELREFFKYREKNGGAFPDLNAASYSFLAYDADYDYPLGTPTCKVVEMNGNEILFDRFDKAVKKSVSLSGSKLVLLSDIEDVVVKYPVQVDRAGFDLDYTVSPSLRVQEQTVINPITGAVSDEISFIKKTKYAYFQWQVDHTGTVLDPRGYTPLAVGDTVVYDGTALGRNYYRDGVLYTFTGEWLLDGTVLTNVPVYAANSYYTLTPNIVSEDVYAIIETADGDVTYALSAEEVAAAITAATKDSVITLVRDVALSDSLTIQSRIVLDLAGKTLTLNENKTIVLTDAAAGSTITSSVAGAKIVSSGAAFDAACAFTFEGENIVVTASALLKADAMAYGVVIDGGVFLLDGDTVLVLGDAATLKAEIDATIVAKNAMALADPAKSYAVTLDGTLCGVTIPASDTATVTLSEGLLLSYASAFIEVALPAGVSFENASLVIAAKKVTGDNGAVTNYVVANADEAVLFVWKSDAHEYVMPGEKVAYIYSDYYDAKKFYTPTEKYTFTVAEDSVVGDTAAVAWVGQSVSVAPIYESFKFVVVVEKPDGTFEAFKDAANLSELLSSTKYGDGAIFVLGQKNLILEGMNLTGNYLLNLNGYALLVSGTNKITNGKLTVYSSVAGAQLYSDATQAFLVTNGDLNIQGEKLAYLGGTLANIDVNSTLVINGGIYVVDGTADFFKAVESSDASIANITANKQLFEVDASQAWETIDETATIGGIDCALTVKLVDVEISDNEG